MDVTGIGKGNDTMMANVQNAVRQNSLQRIKAALHSPEKIDETAQEFEAQFISQMLSTMFSTIEEDKVTGGGTAEQTFRSFLTDEYGKIIARAGGIGVSDQVKREMLRMQEVEGL